MCAHGARSRPRRQECGNGKAGQVSRLDAGPRHAVQRRQVRRAGVSRAGRLADRLGLARPGARRDDRREPDAQPRRASPCGERLHRRGARPRAGDRRRRLQQHRRGDRTRPARREGRRRRRARGHALLQQADAGRPLPAFQGHQRRHRHSDPHLQHSRPQRHRHVGRDDEAACRTRQHRRREGRHRRSRPRLEAAPRARRRFHSAFGRGYDGALPIWRRAATAASR